MQKTLRTTVENGVASLRKHAELIDRTRQFWIKSKIPELTRADAPIAVLRDEEVRKALRTAVTGVGSHLDAAEMAVESCLAHLEMMREIVAENDRLKAELRRATRTPDA